MIDPVIPTQLMPVLQSLLATALWAAGGRVYKAAAACSNDLTERLGIFTAQTLSAEAILEAIRDGLPEPENAEQYERVLAEPELQILVHELLTTRLLEQHQPLELVDQAMAKLVASALPELDPSETARIAADLYEWLDRACCAVAETLDEADPSLRASIQMLGGLSSLDVTMKRIARTVEVLAERTVEVRRDELAYLTGYRSHLVRNYGVITLPDLDTERTVPVDRIYVPPTINLERAEGGSQFHSPEELLAQARRSVLLGQPGGGKSTLAGVLAYRLAQSGDGVPFLVVLRKYGPEFEEGLSIVQHLERTLNVHYQQRPPNGWVERVLDAGEAVVIFDGLDELLNPSKRREIKNAVQAFCHAYPFVRVLVTSRAVGYDQAPMSSEDFALARLGEFNSSSVKQYVKQWFQTSNVGLAATDWESKASGFLRESESVSDLTANPLLLSLMCVLYKGSNYIPESRLSLYEECARLLFKKWDKSREISVPLEMGSDIDSALGHLALWMLESGQATEGVSEPVLTRQCASYLVPRRYERLEDAERVAEEFVSFCRGRAWILADAGLGVRDERLFTFTHRTFLEYYASTQLARLCGTPEAVAQRLAPKIASAEWDVVGQLSLQIANKQHDYGADRALETLLQEATSLDPAIDKAVEFAGRSLQYLVPSPRVARVITRQSYDLCVRQPDQSLGQRWMASPPALAAVMGALQPTLDVVADELREQVLRDLSAAAAGDPEFNGRVLALATLARVCADETVWGHDWLYEYWDGWTDGILSDFRWQPELFSSEVPAAGMGLLETGTCTLLEVVRKYGLDRLWQSMGLPAIGARRVGTLELLHGWLVGMYSRRVFRPSAPDRILTGLASLVGEVPVPFGPWPPGIWRGEGQCPERTGELSMVSAPGGVWLLCIAEEAMRDSGSWAYDSPPAEEGAVLVLASDLCRRRGQNSDQELEVSESAQELWAGMPKQLRALLKSWAQGEIDFWSSRPERPPAVEVLS